VSPGVIPATVIGEALPLLDTVAPPLLETHNTVKEMMGLPPVLPGVNGTVEDVTTGCVTVPTVKIGAPGTVAAVKAAEAVEAGLFPTPLVASTVQV